MILDQAITKARSLDFAAREGWPMGEPANLAETVAEVLYAIDAKVAAAPADERASLAASIKSKIDGRKFQAGVATRKTA